MDCLRRRTEQQLRLLVTRRPAAFTINALPGDLEQLVYQHYSLWTAAPRTRYAVFVEHLMSGEPSLHVHLVGSYNPLR